jgi:hypothetical protein
MKSGRALALAALARWRSGSEFADKIVAETFARSSLAPDRAALELSTVFCAILLCSTSDR